MLFVERESAAEHVREFFQQFKKDMGTLKEEAPDTLNGFAGLSSKIMKNGAVSLETKEPVAIGIAVAGWSILLQSIPRRL